MQYLLEDTMHCRQGVTTLLLQTIDIRSSSMKLSPEIVSRVLEMQTARVSYKLLVLQLGNKIVYFIKMLGNKFLMKLLLIFAARATI